VALDLTLIVTYSALSPAIEQAVDAWRRLVADTWVCRVGETGRQSHVVPDTWQTLPDQPDAAGVGAVAVGSGDGAWLLLVNALDEPASPGWARLERLMPELDPQTIYLLPLTVGDRFADVQPRLIHRTGMVDERPASPAADLGLQMALLPVWPLQRDTTGGWSGLHGPDALSEAMVHDGRLDALTWPDPEQGDLPFALRLLIADHYRQREDYHEARCWLEPALHSGPPAIRVGLGLIALAEDHAETALDHFSVAWRAAALVQWPGYYPRDVIDRHYLGLVVAEAYRRLGIGWAAELFMRMAEGTDRVRQDRLLVSSLAEQAERNGWDGVLTVQAYHWGWAEQTEGWRDMLAAGGHEADLAKAAIWHALETAGLKRIRSTPLWQRVARNAPADARASQQLGSQALRAERWQEAARHLQDALARDPQIGWVWNSLAVAQVRLGLLFDAEKSFRMAGSVAQPEPSSARNLAELERMMARQIRP
jgi:tetratricopeptide (TPR) repeat protein